MQRTIPHPPSRNTRAVNVAGVLIEPVCASIGSLLQAWITRADAMGENWNREELAVVERMVAMFWESMKLDGTKEETTETAYLTALVDHLRKRFLNGGRPA